jgi:hypothetical protein
MDSVLLNFFRTSMAKPATPDGKSTTDGLGLNLVRICSEAVVFGVGKLLTENNAHQAQVYRK